MTLGFQLILQLTQGQIQRQTNPLDRLVRLLTTDSATERLANQHRYFTLIVHLALACRQLQGGITERHHSASRLDKQQRLTGYRIVQFTRMFGIIAPNTDNLAQWQVDKRAVSEVVLVGHQNLTVKGTLKAES